MYNHTSDPPRTRPADSWIAIPSRPSNSSLSSAAADDAVPQPQSQGHRRRRPHTRHLHAPLNLENELRRNARSHGGSSSQEEYDESESESDRVITSSNEALAHNSASDGHTEEDDDEEDYDDYDDDQDEIATAIGGYTDPQCFTPQPNAFSHPPSASRSRSSAPGSYFPPMHSAPTSQRHSYPGNQHRDQRPSQTPSNAVSPSHQAHHDAALRASLTTLLSCAAAARGLPKKQESSQANTARAPSGRVETTTLRMVPESVALGAQTRDNLHSTQNRSVFPPESSSPSSSRRGSSSSPPGSREPGALFQQYNQQSQQAQTQDKSKRKAASGNNAWRSSSKDRRAVKKPRRLVSSTGNASIDEVSPTAMTWVVSAGLLVLVSALSFSYGYSVGRETGRLEGSTVGNMKDLGENATGCAREVGPGMGKGLKRLRWGSAAASVRA